MDMLLPTIRADHLHVNRITRPLLPGESVPPHPGLLEQVFACIAEIEYVTCSPVAQLESDEDDLDFLFELAV